MLTGMPRPNGATPKAPKGSVQDALESLERKRRKPAAAPAKAKRGDLDLDSIP